MQLLQGMGIVVYLDGEQIIVVVKLLNCDVIYLGYGFLSEDCEFVQCCIEEGFVFIGLDLVFIVLFGDKICVRELVFSCGVKVSVGILGGIILEQVEFFFLLFGFVMMIKVVVGGGGKGMWVVCNINEL